MENTNSYLLNRLFSRNTLRDLLNEGKNDVYTAAVRRYLVNYTNKTNRQCISEIYHEIKNNYQNEYYYKNTLLNKLLLGIHSLKTTAALTELPIATSKADFILINGKAIVYEIKTPLDNFERLQGQLKDYYKGFTRVIVVTSESQYEYVEQTLKDSPAGICVLTRKGTLSIRKKPIEYCNELSKTVIFKILRKKEFEYIINKVYGELPRASQFEYYRVCQKKFEDIPIDISYPLFLKALKNRTRVEIERYEKVPYELKFLAYFSEFSKVDYEKLDCFLCK